MNALPIVHRELRVAARKRGTYVSRAVVAGIVVGLWLILSAVNARQMSATQLAKSLFWTYGILALLYALLSGVFFTADSLSAERRDGTLGLLFLTDLKGFDVVLGRLAATSWHGIYSLLVIVPVLGLPLLMGGVSHMEMTRLVVVILSAMFYSLALGLLISTLCSRLVTVVAATFVVLLVQCCAPWIIAVMLAQLGQWHAERVPLVWFCPFTSLVFLPDTNYQATLSVGSSLNGVMLFWLPVFTTTGLGVLCLVAACQLLPRVWQREQQPRSARRTVVGRAGTNASGGSFASGGRLLAEPDRARAALLETNPYAWLVSRERDHNRWLTVAMALLGFLCLGLFAMSFANRRGDFGFTAAIFGAFALHVTVKGWLSLESSRRFCDDRQSGALELLLVTPVRIRDVVQGEAAALRRAFRVPMWCAFSVNLALVLGIVLFDPMRMRNDRWWFAEIIFWGGMVLWLDARAFAYTGMLTGIRATRHHRAVLGTIARVLLPPWIAVVLFFLLVVLPGSGLSEDGFLLCLRGWFLLCVLLDLFLIHHAKSTLNLDLRTLSAGEAPTYADGFAPEPSPAEAVGG